MNNKHHLFTYYQIRKELVKIFGEPKTDDEHIALHKEIRRVRKIIPVYEIDINKHREIHKVKKDDVKCVCGV